MRRFAATLAVVVPLAAAAAPAKADPPRVLASVKPIHSLVAAVMQGIGTPDLIVKGAASPHTYALKPSDARALEQAALVFWAGPELEGFLAKPLEANAGRARVVTLMKAPGMRLLETREGGVWDAHDHGDAHGHDHAHGHDDHAEHDHDRAEHDHDDEEHDAHLWLHPGNATVIVDAAADALSAADPANADRYRANAAATTARITALDAELAARLAPVSKRPFITFHDAYHYLEDRYGLTAVGTITVSPERRPSAARLTEIRAKIASLKAACVFAEPQFEPALVDTIVKGTDARKGVLDPEGAALADGPDLWFTLMRANADALAGCLGG